MEDRPLGFQLPARPQPPVPTHTTSAYYAPAYIRVLRSRPDAHGLGRALSFRVTQEVPLLESTGLATCPAGRTTALRSSPRRERNRHRAFGSLGHGGRVPTRTVFTPVEARPNLARLPNPPSAAPEADTRRTSTVRPSPLFRPGHPQPLQKPIHRGSEGSSAREAVAAGSRWMPIMANLIRSAAEPWMTVLMAVRSARFFCLPGWARTPLIGRRRPRIVLTNPRFRQVSRTSAVNCSIVG